MNASATAGPRVADFQPQLETFREDFIYGLSSDPRRLYSKYLYDAEGSRLFDKICQLEEYFPTRTEIRILEENAKAIRDAIGPQRRIVEFGSGGNAKTQLLLKNLLRPAAYLPIDISKDCLARSAQALALAFPDLEILPICADYTEDLSLTRGERSYNGTTIFFPGSTIGNFEYKQAVVFLQRAKRLCGSPCSLLTGIALQTDRPTLERAYNDRSGVTAAFNRNILWRAKRELGAEVDPEAFEHWARYDPEKGRIEMRLVSQKEQCIKLDGLRFDFETGTHILTEYSHKYTLSSFSKLAERSGFSPRGTWTDPDHRFSVQYFESL